LKKTLWRFQVLKNSSQPFVIGFFYLFTVVFLKKMWEMFSIKTDFFLVRHTNSGQWAMQPRNDEAALELLALPREQLVKRVLALTRENAHLQEEMRRSGQLVADLQYQLLESQAKEWALSKEIETLQAAGERFSAPPLPSPPLPHLPVGLEETTNRSTAPTLLRPREKTKTNH